MVKQELSIHYLVMILVIFLQELGEGVFQEGKPDILTRFLKIERCLRVELFWVFYQLSF